MFDAISGFTCKGSIAHEFCQLTQNRHGGPSGGRLTKTERPAIAVGAASRTDFAVRETAGEFCRGTILVGDSCSTARNSGRTGATAIDIRQALRVPLRRSSPEPTPNTIRSQAPDPVRSFSCCVMRFAAADVGRNVLPVRVVAAVAGRPTILRDRRCLRLQSSSPIDWPFTS